jgi:F0F1-type ATP synthase membrane subunit c/vacuolar-type H+-ATPase subunit K
MEETQKTLEHAETIHKRNKWLFISAMILTGIGILGILGSALTFSNSAGKLTEALVNSKESDEKMLKQITINTGRLTNLEVDEQKRIIIDSVHYTELKKGNDENSSGIKDLQKRMVRMEWIHKIPPDILKNQPSIDTGKMRPFNDLSIIYGNNELFKLQKN